MDAVTLALIKSLSGGGGGSLPSVTSSDNGKVLAVKDGAWAADSNLFVVTANGTLSVDKTYAEIVAAYEAGESVYLVNSGETYILSDVSSYAVDFVSITNGGKPYTYRITSSNAKFSNTYTMLPKVGASDNGSEMIVTNGSWTKQKKKFIVTLTPNSLDYSGTMDKTANEITAAYEAGQEIVFNVVGFPGFDHVYIPAAWCTYATDNPNCAACATLVDVNNGLQIIIFTSDADDSNVYYTSVYSLTPAS